MEKIFVLCIDFLSLTQRERVGFYPVQILKCSYKRIIEHLLKVSSLEETQNVTICSEGT